MVNQGNLNYHFVYIGQVKKTQFERDSMLVAEMKREYPNIFSEPSYPITINRTPFTIPLIDPICSQIVGNCILLASWNWMNWKYKSSIWLIVSELYLAAQLERIIPSLYSTLILFTKKKRVGTLQLCLDYQSFNANTVTNSWLLPRIDELLTRLKGAHCFWKLDLQFGYHQILLAKQDQFKSDSMCIDSKYEFCVVIFGFKNAKNHFKQSMNLIINDLLNKCILVYIDYILIYSRS